MSIPEVILFGGEGSLHVDKIGAVHSAVQRREYRLDNWSHPMSSVSPAYAHHLSLVDVVEGTSLGSKLVALYLDNQGIPWPHGASAETAYMDAVATIDFVLSKLGGDKRRLVVITPYLRGIRDYWRPTHTLNNRVARYLDGAGVFYCQTTRLLGSSPSGEIFFIDPKTISLRYNKTGIENVSHAIHTGISTLLTAIKGNARVENGVLFFPSSRLTTTVFTNVQVFIDEATLRIRPMPRQVKGILKLLFFSVYLSSSYFWSSATSIALCRCCCQRISKNAFIYRYQC